MHLFIYYLVSYQNRESMFVFNRLLYYLTIHLSIFHHYSKHFITNLICSFIIFNLFFIIPLNFINICLNYLIFHIQILTFISFYHFCHINLFMLIFLSYSRNYYLYQIFVIIFLMIDMTVFMSCFLFGN